MVEDRIQSGRPPIWSPQESGSYRPGRRIPVTCCCCPASRWPLPSRLRAAADAAQGNCRQSQPALLSAPVLISPHLRSIRFQLRAPAADVASFHLAAEERGPAGPPGEVSPTARPGAVFNRMLGGGPEPDDRHRPPRSGVRFAVRERRFHQRRPPNRCSRRVLPPVPDTVRISVPPPINLTVLSGIRAGGFRASSQSPGDAGPRCASAA